MISYLKGKPVVFKNYLTVITNGVGYKVFTGDRAVSQVQQNKDLELFIYTHVKEDKLELYGFLREQDLQIFELVLAVSGVGPKTALMIVEAGVEKMVDAVQNARISFFTAIPRIGKKLSQKIIIELKSKLGSLKELELGPIPQKQQDLVDGLIGLGFDEASIELVVAKIDTENLTVQESLKQAIKLMQNGK